MSYFEKDTVLNNRYMVKECIGVGGMAVVYKGRDIVNNIDVALKVLKPEFSLEEQNITRFKKEAESAYRLNHPNIVKIYGFGHFSGAHYIAMQYIDGITLTEYMEKCGVFDWRDAFEIVTQILSALSLAHSSGVVHRDIKPQNILVDENMHVTLTDFGIAQDNVSANTINANSSACSVHYLSPEQARGAFIDGRSDIYSLGITLYEMIVGAVPFDGESTVAVALKHLRDKIVPPCVVDETIPRGVSDVVMLATTRDIGRRFQSADEMLAQMRIVSEKPETACWNPPVDMVSSADGTRVIESEPISIPYMDELESFGEADEFDDDVKTYPLKSSPEEAPVAAEDTAGDAEDGAADDASGSEDSKTVDEDDFESGFLLDSDDEGELSDGDDAFAEVNADRFAGAEAVSSDEDGDDDEDEYGGEEDDAMDEAAVLRASKARVVGKVLTYIVASVVAVAVVFSLIFAYNKLTAEPVHRYIIESYEGYRFEAVEAALKKAGIVVERADKITEDYPVGYVVSQNIAVGESLKAGDKIKLEVARTANSVALTDFVSQKYEGDVKQAFEKLEHDLNITVDLRTVPGKTLNDGVILKTFPKAGAEISRNDTIILYVTKGVINGTVTVPKLSNLSLEEAMEALALVNLKVGNIYPNPGEDLSELFATPTPEITPEPEVTASPDLAETQNPSETFEPSQSEVPFSSNTPIQGIVTSLPEGGSSASAVLFTMGAPVRYTGLEAIYRVERRPSAENPKFNETESPTDDDFKDDPAFGNGTEFPSDESSATPVISLETEAPTDITSDEPTALPTDGGIETPTAEPDITASAEPSVDPSIEPTEEASETPTDDSTDIPSEEPTAEPTEEPTAEPTPEPILASSTVVEQYPPAGTVLSEGDSVDLYFYSRDKLNSTEESQEITVYVDNAWLEDGKALVKYEFVFSDGSADSVALGKIEIIDNRLTVEVPFIYESNVTEVYIFLNDMSKPYEKRIVTKQGSGR